ncbi:uncharacterized protein LOC125608605 [Brassica napus]|uniref:uncharacterized protein LOC125608605 n=1 Tax=Brassica napus TaxID=3708 RepID=UPI0020788D83|nr:uncharacterized protein LOC125608605 [Brassica napus]
MVLGHLLLVHHLRRQFRALRHPREFLGPHMPPPPPPPAAAPQPVPAGAVHPDLCVPPCAPYSRYTVEICSPSLDERAWMFWISIDHPELIGLEPTTVRSVSEIIKGYYDGAYPNWSKTPYHQRWHWSLGITKRVKREFIAKEKIRLCNTVSDWKDKWEIRVMKESPPSLRRMYGMILSPFGSYPLLPVRRTRAPLPKERRTKMVICPWFTELDKSLTLESTGVLPSMSDLFKMTHVTSDGIFVDPVSEKLFNALASQVEEWETQLAQQSPDGLPVKLTTEKVDMIFEEVAPRKKGWIVGIGSVNKVAKETSSYASRRDEENSQMRVRMDSQHDRLDSFEDILDVMAVGNPTLQRALNER